ncbi:hypothetical protein MKEN_00891300 [Mycena kentingensis (nom. inval.)]|nr:hypothetical protein MKEN_00891300 [Mycena kentingensis (nom. inval.)]
MARSKSPTFSCVHATYAAALIPIMFSSLAALVWRQPPLAIALQDLLLITILATASRALSPTRTKIIQAPAILALAVLSSSFLFHIGTVQGILEPKQEQTTVVDTIIGSIRFFAATYLFCFTLTFIPGIIAHSVRTVRVDGVEELPPGTISLPLLWFISLSLCIVALAVAPTILVYLFFAPSPTYTMVVLGCKLVAYYILAALPYHVFDPYPGNPLQLTMLVVSLIFSVGQPKRDGLGGVRDWIDTGYVLQSPAGYPVYVAVGVLHLTASVIASSFWYLDGRPRVWSINELYSDSESDF